MHGAIRVSIDYLLTWPCVFSLDEDCQALLIFSEDCERLPVFANHAQFYNLNVFGPMLSKNAAILKLAPMELVSESLDFAGSKYICMLRINLQVG